MILNKPTNKKHYLHSRKGAEKESAVWWHKSPGTIPLDNGPYMWLKDICTHPSLSYLRLGKLLLPSPSPPARVLLYHALVPPFSSPKVLPPACWSSCQGKWGKHSWYFLNDPCATLTTTHTPSSAFPFAVLLFMSFFFAFLGVYCTLNSYVATIHRRTMGTGRQWMTGMQKFFFPSSSSPSPSWKQPWRAIRWKIYSSASSCPVPVSGYLKLSEKWYGGRFHRNSVASQIFSLHIKNKSTLSSLFCPDLT